VLSGWFEVVAAAAAASWSRRKYLHGHDDEVTKTLPDEEFNSQVGWSSLFRLVFVCAGDTKSDAVLAGLLGIFWILPSTADLACPASITA